MFCMLNNFVLYCSPVNRCQIEIQKTVGRPAQAQVIDEFRKDLDAVEHNIQGLDRKLDVLTMVLSQNLSITIC